ncbi:MAG TPA: hypothetical protein VM571_12985, partial [Noviherbaspirillum sp.]|nr:hypothetical protein [Noviherbaspirillum sp.]
MIATADNDPAQQAARFAPFSALPLFGASCGNGKVPASPLLAHAWAEATIRFWEAGLACGSIDPDQPLYLVDPAPAYGQLAWLMLRALEQRLTASPCADLAWCYVACSRDAQQLDFLASHPYLNGYAQKTRFDTAVWDANTGAALGLRAQRLILQRTANPIVLLGLQWLQTLPAELYAVHHGQVMHGYAALNPAADDDGRHAIDYHWPEIDSAELAASSAQALLAHYVRQLPSAPLLVPQRACDAIDDLARLSAGRYLLLSTDRGACSDKQLRMGALTPPLTWRSGDAAPPVNYHALSLHQQHKGARIWTRQLQENGVVLYAACRDDAGDMADAAFAAIVASLDAAHPDDAQKLVASAADTGTALTAETMLPLLRLSRHDPQVLEAGAECLMSNPSALKNAVLQEWQSALERTWENFFFSGNSDSFCFYLGLLAEQSGHWGLAKTAFRFGIDLHGENAIELHRLACCEAATGNAVKAQELVQRALQLEPKNVDCHALCALLANRLQRWQQAGWPAAAAPDGELTLEPIGPEHASSLLYQYRDPQIAIVSRLDALDTLEDAERWIDTEANLPGTSLYAVMHASWGFVGIAGARCADGAAYFYF